MEDIVGTLYSKLHVWYNDGELEGCLGVETESEADCIAEVLSKNCNVRSEIGEINEETVLLRGTNSDYCVSWRGPDLISIVHHMYMAAGNMVLTRFGFVLNKLNEFKVHKCKMNAVVPSKAHQSDTGLDLTVIDVVKRIDDKTVLYGTGITVVPPFGYYFDVVPRSSISKTGYTLANNVGIIDQAYRGEIMVALTKVNGDAKDIELPCRIAQLIPREYHHFVPRVVDAVSDTARGSGGFGSSSEK